MADEAVRNNPELSPQLASKLVQETAAATMMLMAEARMTGQEMISSGCCSRRDDCVNDRNPVALCS
jgi:hypothetical protein